MKKIIPPILFSFCVAYMIGMYFLYPGPVIVQRGLGRIGGIVLFVFGLVMIAWTLVRFRKMETEIHTFGVPRKLCTVGLFRMSRNPIYLGFVLALLGINIALATLFPALGVLLFFLVANHYYIPFEEKQLEETFGEEYLEYKKTVKRWISL